MNTFLANVFLLLAILLQIEPLSLSRGSVGLITAHLEKLSLFRCSLACGAAECRLQEGAEEDS